MAEVEDRDRFGAVVDRIKRPVVADTDTIVFGIAEFFASMRTWMISKLSYFCGDTILQLGLEFSELPFGRRNDPRAIFHLALRSFLVLARRVLNERGFS